MVPGDRLVCAFTEPVATGLEFREWLLHVTVVPWFRTDKPSDEIAMELTKKLDGIRPFEASLGKAEQFGHNRGKSANLIVQPTPFVDIERVVRQYLRDQGAWMVDATTKTQRPFIPHVTAQRGSQLSEGERFQCDSIYIVEQLGGRKQITSVINLAEQF